MAEMLSGGGGMIQVVPQWSVVLSGPTGVVASLTVNEDSIYGVMQIVSKLSFGATEVTGLSIERIQDAYDFPPQQPDMRASHRVGGELPGVRGGGE